MITISRLTINYLGLRLLLILAMLAFALLLGLNQQSVLVSPSHPFVDQNNNGIDDFEERVGDYGDPETRAKIYGVEFPIAELGDCSDYSTCRTFCEDPVNAQTCMDYGKKKGFYKDDPVTTDKEAILARAKQEFGCDSYESCLNFCSISLNYDKCDSFAKKNNLIGGHVEDPGKGGILQKAKEVLGCDSPQACMSYCEKDENREKCSTFAREVGLRGGEQRVGPGGCNSEKTCQAFCSDPANYQVCSGFSQATGGQFTGPGGCSSEASCREYCSENPGNCGYGGPGGGPGGPPGGGYPGGLNPQEMCNRTPNCAWNNNTCQCGFYGGSTGASQKAEEYANFCRDNPDKCQPGQSGGFDSAQNRVEFEKYCRDNPDKCRPGGTGGSFSNLDPTQECARYGCRWSNNSCQCSGGSSGTSPGYSPAPGYSPPPGSSGSYNYGTYSPPPGGYTPPSGSYTNYSPPPGSYTPPSDSYTPPSGSSTQPTSGSYTPPSTESQPPPPSEPAPPPSEPVPPPPSGVQGASTGQGLLQMLWNFLTSH